MRCRRVQLGMPMQLGKMAVLGCWQLSLEPCALLPPTLRLAPTWLLQLRKMAVPGLLAAAYQTLSNLSPAPQPAHPAPAPPAAAQDGCAG
jgi:hypothetical protein